MATMSTSSMNLGLGLGQVGYNGPTGPSPASASSSYHHPQQSQHPLPLQQQQQQHRPQPDPFSYSNGDAIPVQPGSAQLGLSQNGLPRHAGPSGLHIDTTRGRMGEYAQAHSAGPSTGEPNTGFEHLTAPLRSTHPYLSHQQPSSLPPTHPGMTNGQVAYQNQALPMGYPPNAVPSFVSPSGVQGQFAPQHLPPNHPQQQQQQQHPAQPMPGFTFGNPPPMPPHWSNGAVSGPSTMPMSMLPPGVGQGGLPPPPPPPGYVDWDDGDYLDGGDMIYGQLEVSPGSTPTSSLLSSPLQDVPLHAGYDSTIPSFVSPVSSFGLGQVGADKDVIMAEEWRGDEQMQEQTPNPMQPDRGRKRKAQGDLKIDAVTRKSAKGDQGGEGVQVAPLSQGWITPEQLLSSSSSSFPSVPPPSAPASPLFSPPPLCNVLNFYPVLVSPPGPDEVAAMPRYTPRLHTPPAPAFAPTSSARYAARTQSASPDYISPIQVKHRRRTTPEQLKVLEHWFDINPKPDNNLREWLAMELGMTKRNVQVWFQNR